MCRQAILYALMAIYETLRQSEPNGYLTRQLEREIDLIVKEAQKFDNAEQQWRDREGGRNARKEKAKADAAKAEADKVKYTVFQKKKASDEDKVSLPRIGAKSALS